MKTTIITALLALSACTSAVEFEDDAEPTTPDEPVLDASEREQPATPADRPEPATQLDGLCVHMCMGADACLMDPNPECVANCTEIVADCTDDERIEIRACVSDLWMLECHPVDGLECLGSLACMSEVLP